VTVRGSDAAAARPLESPATATAAKPAATNGRSAAPRAAEARETAPPPDPEKAAEIFRQLRMQLTPGTRHAVIQLAPEELGRIAIRVSIRDGRVTGEIRAESEETLAILEKHVPELRAALAQTGFEAADFALARHGDRSARSPLAREPIAAAPAPARPSDAPALRLPNTPVLTEERVDLLA
jgi:flagellar hook-length control protein FliK